MKRILIFLTTFISLSSFAQDKIINDKNAEVRSVSAFSSITVSGGIDIYLSQGNEEALAVSASEEKFRDRIKTEVEDGVLKIYFDSENFKWDFGSKDLRVYISFTDLKNLKASGSSDIKSTNVMTLPALNLSLSGSSDFEGNINISDMEVNLSGASDLKIGGTVKNLRLDASGASDVKGYDLIAENCDVKVSGASDIYITVNKEISAHASGASSVYYKGEATIKEQRTSGASTISRKG